MNFAVCKLLAFVKYMFTLLTAVNFQDGDMKLTYQNILFKSLKTHVSFYFFLFFSYNTLILDERHCRLRQWEVAEKPVKLKPLSKEKLHNKICQELTRTSCSRRTRILDAKRYQRKREFRQMLWRESQDDTLNILKERYLTNNLCLIDYHKLC